MSVILKKIFKSIPLSFDILHRIKFLTDSTYRNHYRKQEALSKEWEEKAGQILSSNPGMPSRKVIFFGMERPDFIFMQSIFLKSFELAGLEPYVLLPKNKLAAQTYRKCLGVKKILYLDDFCCISDICRAKKIIKGINEFDSLISFTWQNIRVGKYVTSTLMRNLRKGFIDLKDGFVRKKALSFLSNSLYCAGGALKIIDKIRPDAVVFVDRGYTPQGEFFDACINNKISCYTWNAAHKSNTLMLKRYDASNCDVHPSSLSSTSWNSLKALKWTDTLTNAVRSEIEACYVSKDWYSEVGTQFQTHCLSAQDLKRRLNLDNRPVAIIFSHIFWDATFFWGEDLFRDYEDWFVQTVKAACQNKKLNWIIKVHPANVVKNKRDGVVGEPSEVQTLKSKIGKLPDHVHLLNAASDISTWSLFQIMDYCLTVRGTVGIEAALLGKRVLTAGTGRYDRMGFTLDFDTKEEYLDQLAHLQDVPPMSEKEKELALKYGYGVFICRPVDLKAIRYQYLQDEYASLKIDFCCNSAEEFFQSPDILSIAEWIKSGEEDYFVLGK